MTTPDPAQASAPAPSVRDVLGILADWREACAAFDQAEDERREQGFINSSEEELLAEQQADAALSRVFALDPAHLRTLAASLPAPAPAEALRESNEAVRLLRELEWAATHRLLGEWHSGSTSECCPVCRGVKPGELVAEGGGMTNWNGHRPDCRLAALLAAPPEQGAQAQHVNSGKVYRIIGPAQHKALGERWIPTVWYVNEAGERFSREVENFEASFTRLDAQPEGASDS